MPFKTLPERTVEIKRIYFAFQIPSHRYILSIPRNRSIKLVFIGPIKARRQAIGKKLQDELRGFQVGIHTIYPEINIAKLITDKEIDEHQLFFERCGKDYNDLAESLIYRLANFLGVAIDSNHPLSTFGKFKAGSRHKGKMGDWEYYFHGIHCAFKHGWTQQTIEVPLVFANHYGGLDPYFFTRFIMTTPEYRPLPVEIYEDYSDGIRIIEKMLSLGRFKEITAGFGDRSCVVITEK